MFWARYYPKKEEWLCDDHERHHRTHS